MPISENVVREGVVSFMERDGAVGVYKDGTFAVRLTSEPEVGDNPHTFWMSSDGEQLSEDHITHDMVPMGHTWNEFWKSWDALNDERALMSNYTWFQL